MSVVWERMRRRDCWAGVKTRVEGADSARRRSFSRRRALRAASFERAGACGAEVCVDGV